MVMFAVWMAVLSAAPVTSDALTPPRAVDRLVAQLGLPRVAGFRMSDPLIVAALPSDRPLAEQLIGRLRALGVQQLRLVKLTASIVEEVRDEGGRWLLDIRRTPEAVHLRLREVDGGLWRAPDPGLFAEATVPTTPLPPDPRTDEPLLPGADPMGPIPTAGVYGPARQLGELPGMPLAMAACETEQTALVLTRTHLFRISLQNGFEILAQLALEGFERRPTPSRFPIGTVVCASIGSAFGTSDFAKGYEVDPTSLILRETLAGAPVASDGQSWLLAELSDGQPQWTVDSIARWSYLGGLPHVTTDPTGRVAIGEAQIGQSGLGATAIQNNDDLIWVRTGLKPWGQAEDEVQLAVNDRVLGDTVAFPNSVRATALGQFAGPAWSLLVALDQGQRTIIQSLRVVLP
ncbi:MAG: hypothetical protein AAFN74_21365 [Myxococcota bacterium]